MKTNVINVRRVKVGKTTFLVPPRIQRIDHGSTHGWQMCHGVSAESPSKFCSDSKYGGPTESLKAAVGFKLARVRQERGRLPRGFGKAHLDLINGQKAA